MVMDYRTANRIQPEDEESGQQWCDNQRFGIHGNIRDPVSKRRSSSNSVSDQCCSSCRQDSQYTLLQTRFRVETFRREHRWEFPFRPYPAFVHERKR